MRINYLFLKSFIDFLIIVMSGGFGGGLALHHFLFKLFVSSSKRFRHTIGKTKLNPQKTAKNIKFVKIMIRKILICVRINFCYRFITFFNDKKFSLTS